MGDIQLSEVCHWPGQSNESAVMFCSDRTLAIRIHCPPPPCARAGRVTQAVNTITATALALAAPADAVMHWLSRTNHLTWAYETVAWTWINERWNAGAQLVGAAGLGWYVSEGSGFCWLGFTSLAGSKSGSVWDSESPLWLRVDWHRCSSKRTDLH